MFTSARLKLTAYYLLIIIAISVLFSLAIYGLINEDYSRMEQGLELRQERELQLGPLYEEFRRQRQLQGLPVPPASSDELASITKARNKLQLSLVLINLFILGAAGVLGYFLAGRTLKPIKIMVDEQNRFITDASHELRTPLTSLKSEIEVYLRDKKLTLKAAKKLLESNLEEVNKLQYLSDNLIKLTQHKFNGKTAFTIISLSEVAAEAVKKVLPLAKKKKIEIKNSIKDYSVEGEKQSLVELLVILLDNAIKYSPPNSIVILNVVKDLKTKNNLEIPRYARNDKWVQIKVKDQGMGISKEDLPHLFDRFYRADKSRSGHEGYGLGLSIAKQIVEKHKGTVKVESEINKGTTFIIQLPLG